MPEDGSQDEENIMSKAVRFIDLFIFFGWCAISILNLIFFFAHANSENLSALLEGEASISFTFMAVSAIIMTSAASVAAYLAIRRGELLERLRKSRPWRAARIVLTAFAAVFIIVEANIVAASFPGRIPVTQEMIILGAQVSRDGLSVTLHNRLQAGLEYAKANPGIRVIVSGGQGLDEPVSEASAMRDYLVSQGLDGERIMQEDSSHNTIQNLKNTMDLLPKSDAPYPITIVTSEYHIRRTAMLAERAGFEPYFIAAGTPPSILPSCYSREFFGLIKSYFMDR